MGGAASKTASTSAVEAPAPAGGAAAAAKAVLTFRAMGKKSAAAAAAGKDDETRPAAKLSLVLTAKKRRAPAAAAGEAARPSARLLKPEPGDAPGDLEALRRLEASADARGGWLKSRLLCHANLLVAAVYRDEAARQTDAERAAARARRFAGVRAAAAAARVKYDALPERERRRAANQGDLDLYSDDALRAREAIRDDPRVVAELHRWWCKTKVVHDVGAAGGDGVLTKDEYAAFHGDLLRILRDDDADADADSDDDAAAADVDVDSPEALAMLEDDWRSDSAGDGVVDELEFKNAVFQVADVWTAGVDAGEYHRFLADAFRVVYGSSLCAGVDVDASMNP